MIPKDTLNEVVEFLYKHEIPEVGCQLKLFESFYRHNPTTAMDTWKKVYIAYTDPVLKYNLNKYKVNK